VEIVPVLQALQRLIFSDYLEYESYILEALHAVNISAGYSNVTAIK